MGRGGLYYGSVYYVVSVVRGIHTAPDFRPGDLHVHGTQFTATITVIGQSRFFRMIRFKVKQNSQSNSLAVLSNDLLSRQYSRAPNK